MRVKARCLALLLAYFVCRNVFLLCGGRLRVNFYAPRVCAAQVCFTDVHTHMCAHSVVCLSDYDYIFIFFYNLSPYNFQKVPPFRAALFAFTI